MVRLSQLEQEELQMKLTKTEMQKYIDIANKQVFDGIEYHYRFGQAMYNLLPKEVTEQIYMTKLDFFYWNDYDAVMGVINEELTEGE